MNMVFKTLVSVAVFQILFLLFVRFDIIRLRRHICMTQGSTFIANKEA